METTTMTYDIHKAIAIFDSLDDAFRNYCKFATADYLIARVYSATSLEDIFTVGIRYDFTPDIILTRMLDIFGMMDKEEKLDCKLSCIESGLREYWARLYDGRLFHELMQSLTRLKYANGDPNWWDMDSDHAIKFFNLRTLCRYFESTRYHALKALQCE